MAENTPPGGSHIDADDQVREVEQLDRDFVLDIGLSTEFEATPHPWYRSPGAVTAIGAIVVAVVALTVSAVLLLARTPAPAQSVEPTVTTDAATTSTTTTPLTAAPVATSIEAPPPEATTVESVESEVVEPVNQEPAAPAPTAEPSGNPTTVERPTPVIRAPVTRTQISVLPPR